MRAIAGALFLVGVASGQIPRPATSEPPANTSGIAPRAGAADYPVHASAPGVTVGAAVLTLAQIKKLFRINLDSAGYVVVEIGLYPQSDGQITVDTDQFRLQIGEDRTLRRAVSSLEIMAPRQSGNTRQPQLGNIPVSTTATIGYESGGPYNRGGVYGGASTTVGAGADRYPSPPYPASTPSGKDPADIERDLIDKELAMGKTTVPVAGYLYFPKPKQKQKNPPYDLTYKNEGAVVRLAIPAAK